MTRRASSPAAEPGRVPHFNTRPAARRPPAAPEAAPTGARQPNGFTPLTALERHQMIAALAHHMARERGFAPHLELDDWLAAEKTIDAIFI